MCFTAVRRARRSRTGRTGCHCRARRVAQRPPEPADDAQNVGEVRRTEWSRWAPRDWRAARENSYRLHPHSWPWVRPGARLLAAGWGWRNLCRCQQPIKHPNGRVDTASTATCSDLFDIQHLQHWSGYSFTLTHGRGGDAGVEALRSLRGSRVHTPAAAAPRPATQSPACSPSRNVPLSPVLSTDASLQR